MSFTKILRTILAITKRYVSERHLWDNLHIKVMFHLIYLSILSMDTSGLADEFW